MPDWLWWAILAIVLATGEIFTLTFFLGPIALAAAAAAIAAGFGASIEIQLVIFIAGSLATLLLLRPIVRRHLRTPVSHRTGTAALVGAEAVVVERVDVDGGQVRLAGEIWTARSQDQRVYEPGARLTVREIQGATALVSD